MRPAIKAASGMFEVCAASRANPAGSRAPLGIDGERAAERQDGDAPRTKAGRPSRASGGTLQSGMNDAPGNALTIQMNAASNEG